MARKSKNKFELTIPSKLERIEMVEKLSEQAADLLNFSEDEKDSLAIAVTEAVNNAIIHGNNKDVNKKVHIKFTFESNAITVRVRDEGGGFNPNNVSDPLDPQNLLKESGRGIFILRALMDHVDFEFGEQGTTLVMTKEKR